MTSLQSNQSDTLKQTLRRNCINETEHIPSNTDSGRYSLPVAASPGSEDIIPADKAGKTSRASLPVGSRTGKQKGQLRKHIQQNKAISNKTGDPRAFSSGRSQSANYEYLSTKIPGGKSRPPKAPERSVSLSAPVLSSSSPSTPTHRCADRSRARGVTVGGIAQEKLVNPSPHRSPKVQTAHVRNLLPKTRTVGTWMQGVQCYSAPTSPAATRPKTQPPQGQKSHQKTGSKGQSQRSRPGSCSSHLEGLLREQLKQEGWDISKQPFLTKVRKGCNCNKNLNKNLNKTIPGLRPFSGQPELAHQWYSGSLLCDHNIIKTTV